MDEDQDANNDQDTNKTNTKNETKTDKNKTTYQSAKMTVEQLEFSQIDYFD